VRNIEDQIRKEIARVMQQKGITQTEYAAAKGISRQSINPYLTGRKLLLTPVASDLLEYLGVQIKLEIITPPHDDAKKP
jgi:transcriptional regulator with XRE-family HTH domain